MSAAEALMAAREAGIEIGIDGDTLILEAASAPPPAVLDQLSRHKMGVIALLRQATMAWSADAWRIFFEKGTAGFAEFDTSLTRTEAEGRAFFCCVVEWLIQNPARSSRDVCAECGQPENAIALLLPFGIAKSGHIWVHSRCWLPWYSARKAKAIHALTSMGVTPPEIAADLPEKAVHDRISL